MSSQPSIEVVTTVPSVQRGSGQSNHRDHSASVRGPQIIQDQGKGTLIHESRSAQAGPQLRRSESRQIAAVQPLAHSVKGAADSINASKGLLYNAIRLYAKDPERGLRARKLMGRTVILHSDLMDWLNRLPVKNAPSAVHSRRGHQRWAVVQRNQKIAR